MASVMSLVGMGTVVVCTNEGVTFCESENTVYKPCRAMMFTFGIGSASRLTAALVKILRQQ